MNNIFVYNTFTYYEDEDQLVITRKSLKCGISLNTVVSLVFAILCFLFRKTTSAKHTKIFSKPYVVRDKTLEPARFGYTKLFLHVDHEIIHKQFRAY